MRQLPACVACGAVMACMAFTQSTEPKPAFVMADIHESPANQGGLAIIRRFPWVGGGRYEIRNVSLLDLISQGYGMDSEKIIGGPSWMEWDRYDVTAKLPAESTPETQKIMLQNLLAERFKLTFHNDTKDLPAYILTAGKSPKLKASEGASDNGCRGQIGGPGATAMPGGGFRINPAEGAIFNTFTCHHMTMEEFAQFLAGQVSQRGATSPVTDQTELKGAWDFDFKTTLQLGGMLMTAPTDNITIFDAVEKQLGLKLTATKASLKVFVVESAQKPTPNAPGVAESLSLALPKEFDVADVKPSDPGGRGGRRQVTRGGGLNYLNMPLRQLILQAYGINNNMLIVAPNMQDALQTGYTILAKPPAWAGSQANGAASNGPQMPMMMAASPDDNDAAMLMLRALLADRFKLTMHQEERQLPAWKLVAVKPKLKKADPTERMKTDEAPGADGKDPRTTMPIRSRLVMFQNVTMAQFADKLEGISAYLQTPVRDATGIEGSYDFTINFSPVGAGQGGGGRGGNPAGEGNGSSAAEAAEPNGAITLFEAIEQQLGLKLVEEKRPVPVYVIDHVESKPTDN